MIRLSRLADYGIVVMTHMARHPDRQHAAPEIAAQTQLPLPTASKILKSLVRAGLLLSHRGVKGGYVLARPSAEVSLAELLEALDEGFNLAECTKPADPPCTITSLCPMRSAIAEVHQRIRDVLREVTLAQLFQPRTLPAGLQPGLELIPLDVPALMAN